MKKRLKKNTMYLTRNGKKALVIGMDQVFKLDTFRAAVRVEGMSGITRYTVYGEYLLDGVPSEWDLVT